MSSSDGDCVIKDDSKECPEKWVPLTDLSMFGGNIEPVDNVEWDKVDFSICRDEAWYKKRFGGFSDDIIAILAHCDGTNKNKDKVQDNDDEVSEQAIHFKEKLTVNFD